MNKGLMQEASLEQLIAYMDSLALERVLRKQMLEQVQMLARELSRALEVIKEQGNDIKKLNAALLKQKEEATRQGTLFCALAGALAQKNEEIFECFVDKDFYYAIYPDVAASATPAGWHYLNRGWQEGRDPAPWFNTLFYLETYADAAASGMCPLKHYLLYGLKKGRQTCEPPTDLQLAASQSMGTQR